jgi:hypothetical protein
LVFPMVNPLGNLYGFFLGGGRFLKQKKEWTAYELEFSVFWTGWFSHDEGETPNSWNDPLIPSRRGCSFPAGLSWLRNAISVKITSPPVSGLGDLFS